MIDKEIIQALDEWRKAIKDDYKRLQLLDAPMDCFEESHTVNFLLLSNAIDLINRQQAEIERLQKENNQFADIGKMYSEIKSEAIKEYREKAAIKLAENARSDYWHWIDDTLYEVEKEMVGEYNV